MEISDIPTINAVLNAIATVLMTVGFVFIKQGKRESHRTAMILAFVVSMVFLIGYVTHKYLVQGMHSEFGGTGAIRTVYYVMLISHILLAIAIAFLVPRTFWLALKGDYSTHKRWARITYPIWYYVSITGVLIYLFLYVWWPKK